MMTDHFLNDEITNACQRAIACIDSEQLANGSFSEQTTFYTGLIINALENSTNAQSIVIKQKGLDFLLRQRSRQWSYNYWQRDSLPYMAKPYPDDLDDTFVALQAISIAAPDELHEKVWSKIMALLINNESVAGGPYQTWVMPTAAREPAWDDIDPAVNATIAAFLSRFDIALPAMQDYFDRLISKQTFRSKYYHDEITVMYFLAKAYQGNQSELLKNLILNKRNQQGYWASALATAHAVSALLMLGQDPASLGNAIQYMLDTEKDGCWPKTALYIEARNGEAITYSNCDAYTSACCIEALQLYLARSKTAPFEQNDDEAQIIKRTVAACKNIFSRSGELLQNQLSDMFNALLQKDPRSTVITMPYYFLQHMRKSHRTTPDVIQNLTVATTLGWIGYTIIDKAVDGEPMTNRLPLSVKCIRESYALFQSWLAYPSHRMMVEGILNGIEQAVLWEHTACNITKDSDKIIVPDTLPDYGDYDCLAQKSLGFALAPVIMCLNQGDVEQAKIVEIFFKHYLIARQLNDDAHDWLDDLKQGFFNSVSVGLIKLWKTQYENTVLDLATEQKILQELFWQKHIDIVCNDITDHCREAREALARLTIVTDTVFLEILLLPLEQAAGRAVIERNKILLLLSAIE